MNDEIMFNYLSQHEILKNINMLKHMPGWNVRKITADVICSDNIIDNEISATSPK